MDSPCPCPNSWSQIWICLWRTQVPRTWVTLIGNLTQGWEYNNNVPETMFSFLNRIASILDLLHGVPSRITQKVNKVKRTQ